LAWFPWFPRPLASYFRGPSPLTFRG